MCGSLLPERDSAGARFTESRSAQAIRSRAGFAAEWLRSWSSAGLELRRVRRELRACENERGPRLAALGDAVYREDDALAEGLRSEIDAIDVRIDDREAGSARAVEEFHRHVEDERLSVRPTELAVGPVHGPPRR
jgi:hypothetical protein